LTAHTERMMIIESLNTFAEEIVGIKFTELIKPGIAHTDAEDETSLYQTIDFGTRIPDISAFYGRTRELGKIEQWINNENINIVGLFGIAGIGKTSLAAKLVQQVKNKFEYIVWYSLINAPPLDEFMKDAVDVFSDYRGVLKSDETIDKMASRFLHYLTDKKCLIILDNYESIFRSGSKVGDYLDGYHPYGDLLQKIAQLEHKSTIILTSREKPKELGLLQGRKSRIRTITIKKLSYSDGIKILRDKGLSGSRNELQEVVSKYSGNPLALKFISETIHDVFLSDIGEFLRQTASVPLEISDVLDEQFNRLTKFERDVIFWLAVEREGGAINDLRKDTTHLMAEKHLIFAINSLQKRSLVDITDAGFILPNVVMEYITDKLVEVAISEVTSGDLNLLISHAFTKAQSKEHTRNSQVRLILTPVFDSLTGQLNKQDIAGSLSRILSALQREDKGYTSYYAAGNIINMFVQFEIELDYRDFSNLPIWQAYLKKTTLRDTNFTMCDFSGTVFVETFGQVLAVAFSPKNDILGAGTAAGVLLLWDLDNFMRLRTFQGHKDWVRRIAFSPTDNIIASGSDDYSVKLWDIEKNVLMRTLEGHKAWVLSLVFSPNGLLLVSGDGNGEIRVWDIQTGSCHMISGHTNWIRAIDFRFDGKILATGSEDLTLKLWDVESWENILTISDFTDNITDLKFSPDGTWLLISCYDDVQIRNAKTGQYVKSLKGHTHRVFSVSINNTGDLAATSSEDETIRIWDVKTGDCIKILHGHSGNFNSVCFNSNGNLIASGGEDQSIKVWDTESGKSVSVLRGYTNWVRSVAVNPKTDKIASLAEDKSIRFWETETGLNFKTLTGYGSQVTPLVFDNNGERLFFARDNHDILIWDTRKEKKSRILSGHKNRVRALAYTPTKALLASGGESKTIRLWHLEDGLSSTTLTGHDSWVRSLSFDKFGEKMASCSEDKTIKIWDMESGQCINTIELDNYAWAIAFHPNNKWVVSGGEENLLQCWDIESGQCVYSATGHSSPIYAIKFSYDGKHLVSGGFDHKIILWDTMTGELLDVFEGHESWVWSLDFNKSGNCVISGSADETIKIWDLKTRKCIRTLRSNRPYERMNITGVKGLEQAQKDVLFHLGAIEVA